MDLKGSKTEKNLQTAFAGESQARNKYTYYASKAKKEGYEAILFFVIQMKEVRYFTPNQKTLPVMKKSMPNYGSRHCMAALFPRLLKI